MHFAAEPFEEAAGDALIDGVVFDQQHLAASSDVSASSAISVPRVMMGWLRMCQSWASCASDFSRQSSSSRVRTGLVR